MLICFFLSTVFDCMWINFKAYYKKFKIWIGLSSYLNKYINKKILSYVKWTMWSDCSLKIWGKNAPLDSGNLNYQKNSLKLFFVLSFLFQREMNHNSRISKFDLHCIVSSNQLSLVVPGEKPHRIFEDLQGLSKTCQRSLRTRIFKRSLKDL